MLKGLNSGLNLKVVEQVLCRVVVWMVSVVLGFCWQQLNKFGLDQCVGFVYVELVGKGFLVNEKGLFGFCFFFFIVFGEGCWLWEIVLGFIMF